MERDFLGINSKDSGPPPENGRGSRQDSVYVGGSAMQWPFMNMATAMQQFGSFKQHEERQKQMLFDQLSSGFQPIPTVDAFEACQKSSPALAPQKSFNLERQGVRQYGMHVSQPQDLGSAHQLNQTRMFPIASYHSIPVIASSPFFKVQGVPSGPNLAVNSLKQQPFGAGLAVSAPVGLAPRSVTKPASTTAQLTIFYAGAVNVYDDVPLDKAQAIMLLASKGSNVTSNTVNPQSEPPALAPAKAAGSDGLSTDQNLTPASSRVTSPCSGLSSPLSVTSQTGPKSGSGATTNEDTAVIKTAGSMAPASQNEPSKTLTAAMGSAAAATIMPRGTDCIRGYLINKIKDWIGSVKADPCIPFLHQMHHVEVPCSSVPQARKASLARFLEKRKERVATAMPYPCINKTPENAESSSFSSNWQDSWCLGQQKNSADSGESPTTKLQI